MLQFRPGKDTVMQRTIFRQAASPSFALGFGTADRLALCFYLTIAAQLDMKFRAIRLSWQSHRNALKPELSS
tara:strand:+ start:1763 stop:1978 length:216 start_codon:yes stop_codon:yes gene_type:complete